MSAPRVEVRLEAHASRQFDKAPRHVQADLRRKARALSLDPQRGAFVVLPKVPKATRRRWEARVGSFANLYRLPLAGAWRALYTVGTEGPLRVVLILEVVDHREYDRLLGYG